VRNVLANAIKFSPACSRIEVDAYAEAAGTLELNIRDHGPGIPASELEKIFDAFVQSSLTKDGSGGTGLGLAISRKIMAAQGGQIWATNMADGGSCFHIQLPARGFAETMPATL
jgi:signal transduction histidine kinase